MKFHAVVFLAVLSSLAIVDAAIIPPQSGDGPQCNGLNLDYGRLVDVTKNDLNTATGSLGEGRSYGVDVIVPVTKFGTTRECILKRHRLTETRVNIPVFGADVIVTVDDCSDPDMTAFGDLEDEENPLAGLPMSAISRIEGKSYAFIDVNTGYDPTYSVEEATEALAKTFDTPEDKVGELELIIFPSLEQGDLLAYKTEVMVSRDGEIELYDVFMNADDLTPIRICSRINGQRVSRRRKLRQLAEHSGRQRKLETIADMCGSCADQSEVTWSDTETECSINSLYLNDTGRTATCLVGTLADGTEVLGPGSVAALHYAGTYDCNSRESGCAANAIPLGCSDSISDVHYGVTKTMQFYQEYLGVMGGLRVDATNPRTTAAFTHFGEDYCNAFFTTQTNALYFGDCDCEFWTPLTSLDVASHEYTHGVTNYASGLVYEYQSGGLNEGYSDIMGATMEFYLQDDFDTPDFNLGENLVGSGLSGFILRYMETPSQDGESIGNVCEFTNAMNVHFTSGVPNKAFVKSVRACQADSCSASIRECVLLLGPIFMYGNIHMMQRLGGYMESATATCYAVSEYYNSRSPETGCSVAQATQFIKDGWATVGLVIDETCTASSPGCDLPGPGGGGGGSLPFPCQFVVDAFRSTIGWVSWLLNPFGD